MFADLETRVNRVATGMLANAIALVDGVEIPGIFEAHHVLSFDVATGSAPAFQALASDLGDIGQGDEIVITKKGVSTNYFVGEVQPDGAGYMLLILDRV